MKGIKITFVLLIICQAVIAQQKTAEEIATKKLEKIESIVELTPEQRARIESIVAESSSKLVAIRDAGEFNREQAAVIKKEERKLITDELTTEQRDAIKNANAGMRAERKEMKAQRVEYREAKESLKHSRASFEASLTADEKKAIEKARTLIQQKPSKEERKVLSEEEKAKLRANNKEVLNLLQPIIENHRTELSSIKNEMPSKPAKKESINRRGNEESRFYRKFLLMK